MFDRKLLLALSALLAIGLWACDDGGGDKNETTDDTDVSDGDGDGDVIPLEMAVTSVAPNGGPLAGGTVVTISGRGFVSGATVRFGDTAGTDVSFLSASQVKATTPPATTGGKVSVTVTNPDGESASRADAFEYRAPVVDAVDWCALHWPASTSVTPGGTTEPIFARAWEAGCTDGGQQCTRIAAELGYGGPDTDPSANPNAFTWFPATNNASVDSYDNDEFMASLTINTAGTYAYAYRMRIDGGEWTYCDLDPGSSDGITTDKLGSLRVAENVVSVGWCGLHWPSATSVAPGLTSEPIFGRVWAPGCSEGTAGCTALRAELGYGPPGVDPSASPAAYTWLAASYNDAWSGDDNDEFMASLQIATAGTYSYAYRFSADGGVVWTYCDLGAGSTDGIQAEQLGSLTVAEDVVSVGWCALHFPQSTSADPGSATEAIYGRVFAEGCSELEAQCTELSGQIGYGPVGSNPALAPATWTWSDASYNAAHVDDNNDEYQATLTLADEGSYAYAYRFSADGGASWQYCDFGAGSGDGIQEDQLGSLTVGTADVAWCEIVYPAETSTVPAVPSESIYAQVLVPGCTGNDGVACASLQVELGWGAGDDPAAFAWAPAAFNAAHTGDDNDEFMGALTLADAGSYHFAYRASVDGGATWTFCDTDGDTAFAAAELGSITVANRTIEWCGTWYPATTTAAVSAESEMVYGRVFVAGCTNGAARCHGLRAELGFGPTSDDPAVNPGVFDWSPATYNAGHVGDDNDEYQTTLFATTAGTYSYAYRFSGDAGATWTYCDTTDDATYNPAELGVLTVQ